MGNRRGHTAEKRKVPEYHGVQQFREDRGLIFGGALCRGSKLSVGVLRLVRFEAR